MIQKIEDKLQSIETQVRMARQDNENVSDFGMGSCFNSHMTSIESSVKELREEAAKSSKYKELENAKNELAELNKALEEKSVQAREQANYVDQLEYDLKYSY